MPVPGNVTQVTIHDTITNPATGAPAVGTVSFTMPPSVRTTDGYPLGNTAPYTATLSGGSYTLTLPSTDDPILLPSGWLYTVRVATDAVNATFQSPVPMVPAGRISPPAVTTPLSTAVFTAKGDLLAGTGPSASTRVAVGTNGQALLADSTQPTGVRWGASGFTPTIRSAWITTGNTTLANTAGVWAVVAGYELALPAMTGQWVEIGVHGMRSDTASAFLDIAVVVGSSIVRFLATGTATPALEGDPGWYINSTQFNGQSAGRGFIATPGDIDGANVRFVVAAKATGTGIVYSSTDYPFYWCARNLGIPN